MNERDSSNIIREDSPEYEITCKMFNILAQRASTVGHPRINSRDFSARLGIEWERIKQLLEFVEWYCYEKSLPSLSALVVLTHQEGNVDVSFPGGWFGKHVPDILNKTIPEWKLPLTDSQRNWYRAYWPKINQHWKTTDFNKKTTDFRAWFQSVLEEQRFEEWFPWPSTIAPIGLEEMGAVPMHRAGLFSYLGYHVGENENRPPDDDRKEILNWMFNSELPKINNDEYMAEFAKPKSSMRLKKMADFLASEARNFSRSTRNYSQAIHDYKVDLDYLYDEYYVALFGFDKVSNPDFAWPDFPDDYDNASSDKTDTADNTRSTLQVSHKDGADLVPETELQYPPPTNTVNSPEDKEASKVPEPTDAGAEPENNNVAQPKPRSTRTRNISIAAALLAILCLALK